MTEEQEKILTVLGPLVIAFDKACADLGVAYVLSHEIGDMISLSCRVDNAWSDKIVKAARLLDKEDRCCSNEKRSFRGGCLNCGAPCL